MNLYLVIITYNGYTQRELVKAETYWDAVTELQPGNNAIKVECVELGSIEHVKKVLDE